MLSLLLALCLGAESLPPLQPGQAPPRNLTELWGNYDPRAEPLETTLVREWREGAATCRYVVFTVGTFKGKPARMAAYYAFPAGQTGRVAGLLHLHGGGQQASLHSVVFAALNGYASLSLNWGGQVLALAQPGDPGTDWGALDATQQHKAHYASCQPDGKTLDAVESPRNNNWFLLVLAARRGLTFLAAQPEVDPARLGVSGHSMGGKLTTDLAAIDERVKVAVPSCGGSGSAPGKLAGMPGSGARGAEGALNLACIDDRAYLPRLRCPVLWLAPTNDFAGPLDNMAENWRAIGSRSARYAISPHFNHRHAREFAVSGYLLCDHYLNAGPALAQTPELALKLDTPDGVPLATLLPDRPGEVTRAAIWYAVDPHTLTRFWRTATAERHGDRWTARLPLLSPGQPLYVLASVWYPLTRKYQGYQWLEFGGVQEYALSSQLLTRLPSELLAARCRPTAAHEALIDDGAHDWQDWYRLEWANPVHWTAVTRKVKDPQWRGPDGAQLAVDVQCAKDTVFVVRASVNDWGAFGRQPGGEFAAAREVKGGPDWQTLTFSLADFAPANERTRGKLTNWRYLTELALSGQAEVLIDGQKVKLGGRAWPQPRPIRNLRWVGGQPVTQAEMVGALTPEQLAAQIEQAIKASTDLEARERGGQR
jgi:pimeloyl-ACP methyl ester carboxylesterase